MKKILFNKITIVLLTLVFSTSCTEDFLSETNPNELSTASFWKNNTDLNLGLVAVYNGFKNTSILNLNPENLRADLNYPGFGRPNPNERFGSYYDHTYSNAQNEINQKWGSIYITVFRANQVIENGNRLLTTYTDEVLKDEATLIIAQARFIRGLMYTYLYNMFNEGSVPIIDFVPKDESEFYQPLSPATDVKAFYLADLEFAYENLPPVWDNNADLGRVTAAAAAAELGRSYLYEENYTKASEYFTDIITNADYGRSLTPHINDNFSEAEEHNSESILEIGYSRDFKSELTPGNPENVSADLARIFSPESVGGFRTGLPSCWIIMAYKNEVLDTNDPRNYVPCEAGEAGCDPVSLTRLRSYSIRTSHSLALVDEQDTPYYGGELPALLRSFNSRETAYYRKYTNWETVDSERDIIPNNRSGINVRLVRLADIYLMQAECLIKGGTDAAGLEEAIELINDIRHRSALQLIGLSGTGKYPGADHDDVVYDAQSLMEHLMYVERPLELSVEGHAVRFIDLRRWGILKQRFQDLSTRKYHAVLYSFKDEDGNTINRFGSVLLEGEDPSGNFTFVDYEGAAANYIESIHGYYPIPSNEILANSNL